MNRKSLLISVFFAITVIISVFATYYRYIVLQDINIEIDEEAFQASLLEEE